MRLSELFLCITAFLVLCKAAYVACEDYLMRSRLPFHDEVAELLGFLWTSNLFLRFNETMLPVRFRPRNIHHVDDLAMRCGLEPSSHCAGEYPPYLRILRAVFTEQRG